MITWEIIIMKDEPWDPGHICGFQEMTSGKPAQASSVPVKPAMSCVYGIASVPPMDLVCPQIAGKGLSPSI